MRAVGIILAGGPSSINLKKPIASAALPIAGRYEAIDFTLSNMTNSGIDKVAVITQYSLRSLNEHIKSPGYWGFGRKTGGLFVLSPMITAERQNWYQGTIDALYDSLEFLKGSHEAYVIVASGDGIYKLDYNKIIDSHIANAADITVVCTKLKAGEDASRFGRVTISDDGRIDTFTEKTGKTNSRTISCGIYVMRRRLLITLIEEAIKEGKTDFVSEVLVPRVKDNKVYAYIHKGYWKNISQEDSFYRCNLDFLKPEVRKEFFDKEPQILTKVKDNPPTKYLKNATVKNSIIAGGVVIDGSVENSVVFAGAKIEKGAKVIDSIIFPGSVVKKGKTIEGKIFEN